MRITRLYHPGELHCDDTIKLASETSNHLVRVLRSKQETPVILFNGDGFDYSGRMLDTNAKNTSVFIEGQSQPGNESNLDITLIQGLSRQDRMETTIQKSVELGVNRIIPLLCNRSNTKLTGDKRLKKLEHWRKIAISACEQSGRCVLPEVSEITLLQNVSPLLDENTIRITLNPVADSTLKDIRVDKKIGNQKLVIFIGPEGGLNDEEIQFLQQNNFNDIRFGPRILRTETAGPAVISALQMLWGDF